MHASVARVLVPFQTKFESALDFMYADKYNLVTTGIGNLIDSGPRNSSIINPAYAAPALTLPWRHRGTRERATQAEVMDAWAKVKTRSDMGSRGGGTYAGYTDLYLEKSDLDRLFDGRVKQNEDYLRQHYPGYDSWPADAQLGLHSMAWAMGPAFNFPRFRAAVNQAQPNFDLAAKESHVSNLNADRQNANFQLFSNAAEVLRRGLDPSVLYWPGQVVPGQGSGGGYGGGLAAAGVGIGVGLGALWAMKKWF